MATAACLLTWTDRPCPIHPGCRAVLGPGVRGGACDLLGATEPGQGGRRRGAGMRAATACATRGSRLMGHQRRGHGPDDPGAPQDCLARPSHRPTHRLQSLPCHTPILHTHGYLLSGALPMTGWRRSQLSCRWRVMLPRGSAFRPMARCACQPLECQSAFGRPVLLLLRLMALVVI